MQFRPKEHEDGSKTERWLCRDCGRGFRPLKVADLDSPAVSTGDAWDGIPFGPRPGLPGWGGGWAHPELRRRLEKLEASVDEHDNVLDAGTVSDLQHLLVTLRANGVTRYQRGDVAIELRPAVALDAPGMSQWLPDAEPAKHSMDWMSTGQGLTDDDTPEQPLTASGVVLPTLDELRQESDARRRQQEEDRSGVAVEVQE